MLVDEARVKVVAGKGGDGLVSFRREKFIPRGGPDGGDGGDGGNIVLKVSNEVHGLEIFRSQKFFKAQDGGNGMKQKKTGRDGKDLILPVPAGTVVYEVLGKKRYQIADLKKIGQEFVLARGGQGGFGNYHFATSIKQAPNWSKPGLPGEEKELEFELRLIADVGLVGLPNVGKSTLLSVVSAAKPKIAAYPFTTLEPELGIAAYKDKRLVIADIPGLIEGAAAGKGLGDAFLKHIQRTKLIVHLISGETGWVSKDYETIRAELKAFDASLATKPEIPVLTKIDTMSDYEVEKYKNELKKVSGKEPILVSAVTHQGLDKLLDEIVKAINLD